MLIKESFALAATDLDILAAPSRLAAIPANGVLTIECCAGDSDPTNFGQLTVQLPGGDIPLSLVQIPSHGLGATDFILDNNTEMITVMTVTQGGHVLVQYTENGTVSMCAFYITLEF